MKKEHPGKSLIVIGVPILAGFIVSQFQRMTDQAMLGWADPLYLSAIGNASYTLWASISFLFSLATGAAILISQKIGEGKPEAASEFAGSTFVFSSVFSGMVFCVWFFGSETICTIMGLRAPVAGYMSIYTRIYSFSILLTGITTASQAIFQGTGKTRPMMISALIRCGLNIILDWLLIFGNWGFPRMGIAGAALATLLADLIGDGYFISAAFSKKLPVRLSLHSIRHASLKKYYQVVKIGLPAGMEDLLWNLGNIGLIRYLNEISPTASGLYTLVMSVILIPSLVFMAMGNASMTLSGMKTGAKQPHEIRKVVHWALGISAVAASVFCLLLLICPDFFAGFFTRDRDMILQAGSMFMVCSFMLFPRAANIVYGGGIRGTGDTRWMLGTQLFGTLFILISARVLIFGFGLAIFGMFLAVFLDETVRSVMNGLKFYSKTRKKILSLSTLNVEAA